MSLLETLDTSDYFNGKMDKWIEDYTLIGDTFKRGGVSVLVIDPNNQMPLTDMQSRFGNLNLKYIDLAECKEGDYNRIGRHLNQYIDNGKCAYDGLLLDNIDCIDAGNDTEDMQIFVWQALKRDDTEYGGYQMLPFGETIPFDKMKIAARCKEIPGYLKGKSLMSVFINV